MEHTAKLLETAEILINALSHIHNESIENERVYNLYVKIFNAIQEISQITGENAKIKEMIDAKIEPVKPIFL
jgi:hypothetical protein